MRRYFRVLAILLVAAAAGVLLVFERTDYEVSLDSVLETWADLIRDADRFGLTLTRVSVARETEIGREIQRQIARSWGLKDDPTLRAYVDAVGHALVPHVQRKAITYAFFILDAPMVNAFAIPGGGIYITTGMLEFLKSEAELASILGHEMIHVDFKHCIERLQYELAAQKVVGRDLAVLARIGYTLALVGFSEQHELEADVAGMLLAAKAVYDPFAPRAVFERLAAVEAESRAKKPRSRGDPPRSSPSPHPQAKPPTMIAEVGISLEKALGQYLATHPPAPQRARHLQQAYDRNMRAWEGRFFYVGRSNYLDRMARSSDARQDELRIVESGLK